MFSSEFIARFNASVRQGVGCWTWSGAHVPGRYGSVKVPGMESQQGTHRVAWAIATGAWPTGMVLHRCGNAGCVNPGHLYEGDDAQNAVDRDTHGRTALGELHARHKLTTAQVVEIRRRHAAGARQVRLGREFGVSQQQISNIVRARQRVRA